MKKRFKKEQETQKACIKWFRLQYPDSIIFAVPNGGSRNKIEAYHMKQEGVLAGVSDLIVIHKNNVIFVELKTMKGVQSKSQKEFEEKIRNNGFEYHVIRSVDEFINLIK